MNTVEQCNNKNLKYLTNNINEADFLTEFWTDIWTKYFHIFQNYRQQWKESFIDISKIIWEPSKWNEYQLSNELKNIFDWLLYLYDNSIEPIDIDEKSLTSKQLNNFFRIYEWNFHWFSIYIAKNGIHMEDIPGQKNNEKINSIQSIITDLFHKNQNWAWEKIFLKILSKNNNELVKDIYKILLNTYPRVNHKDFEIYCEAIMLVIWYIKWDNLDQIENPESVIHQFNARSILILNAVA